MTAVDKLLRKFRRRIARYLTTKGRQIVPAVIPSKTQSDLQDIYSLVPGAEPVRLVDYYLEFKNYYAECELQTKRWFVENVQPDWCIIDVGANIGYYSVLFARLAPGGRVIACEPTATVHKLRNNLAANGCSSVEVLNVAVGDRSGAIEEDIYRIWGRTPERQTYAFTTLDDLVDKLGISRVDCIKIDTDGFDFDVLRGAERVLARFNPWLVVEVNHALGTRGQNAYQVMEWLSARGYRQGLVLDEENIAFRMDSAVEKMHCDVALALRFEQRPVMISPAFAQGARLPDFFVEDCHPHNETSVSVEPNRQIKVVATAARWSYAVSFAKRRKRYAGQSVVVVVCKIEVLQGQVGIGCTNRAGSAYLCSEVFASSADGGRQEIEVVVDRPDEIGELVFRSTDPSGTTASFAIGSIDVFSGVPIRYSGGSPYIDGRFSALSVTDCANLVGARPIAPQEYTDATPKIGIVDVDGLGSELGFKNPYVAVQKVIRLAPRQFKMEVHDAPILRYIYEQFMPKRHLEFGTWEGFGATLCAQSCSAEIWTLNLPDGERDENGNALYMQSMPNVTMDDQRGLENLGQAVAQTDSGEFIGWRYRAAGYADRIHQILADSTKWDGRAFPPAFFDSILIDGGHATKVVINDTSVALPLLRSGGLMMWHDFCPDADALARMEAPRGVMQAFVECLPDWHQHFSKIFWVRPSHLLIGVKI